MRRPKRRMRKPRKAIKHKKFNPFARRGRKGRRPSRRPKRRVARRKAKVSGLIKTKWSTKNGKKRELVYVNRRWRYSNDRRNVNIRSRRVNYVDYKQIYSNRRWYNWKVKIGRRWRLYKGKKPSRRSAKKFRVFKKNGMWHR